MQSGICWDGGVVGDFSFIPVLVLCGLDMFFVKQSALHYSADPRPFYSLPHLITVRLRQLSGLQASMGHAPAWKDCQGTPLNDDYGTGHRD